MEQYAYKDEFSFKSEIVVSKQGIWLGKLVDTL